MLKSGDGAVVVIVGICDSVVRSGWLVDWAFALSSLAFILEVRLVSAILISSLDEN